MNRWLFALSTGFLAVILALRPGLPEAALGSVGEASPPAVEVGAGIRSAASRFIESLEPAERAACLLELDDPERFNWHFVPRSRKGLPLVDMKKEQRDLLWKLLRAALSATGYQRTERVLLLEGVLRDIEGPERAEMRNPLRYYVTFFARPAKDSRWGWRFEGHHISLNFTLHGDRLSAETPLFFGANPAIVRDGPHKGLRALAEVEDLARELFVSLDDDQRGKCTGDPEVPTEIPGPRTARFEGPFPSGVTLAELREAQRERLLRLIREYTKAFPETFARDVEARRIRAEKPENVHFAWRGSGTPFEPHSYLIHGKTFVIHYSNVQNGGAHVHSALRLLGTGPDSDFGGGVVKD